LKTDRTKGIYIYILGIFLGLPYKKSLRKWKVYVYHMGVVCMKKAFQKCAYGAGLKA
jgi:hypothetical protein